MTLNDFTEILAFFSVIYAYHRWRGGGLRILLINLSSIMVLKIVYFIMPEWKFELLPFNLIVLLQLSLYLIFYLSTFKQFSHRLFARISLVVMLLAWIVNSMYVQDIRTDIQFYSYAVGVLCILTCVILFFYEELLLKEDDSPLSSRYFIWINAGLFVWLCTELPAMGFLNYVRETPGAQYEMRLWNAKLITSALYYLTYIVSLPWAKKT